MTIRPWRDAWQDALYAADGFYRQPVGPAGHFETATHGSGGVVLAQALTRLMAQRGLTTFVDLGAGRGELARNVCRLLPRARVIAVDIVERPGGLPDAIEWLTSPGGAGLPDELRGLTDTLLLAHEWLDVVPCTVGEVDDHGVLREVLVADDGTQSLGAPLRPDDLAWCQRYWPASEHGDRVEVGISRDAAWSDLVSRLDSGLALAVDYAHQRQARPPFGTLAAYRDGVQCEPVPDGTCDLTAHVAIDSLATDQVTTQRDMLRSLGVTGRLPQPTADGDPAAYLRDLTLANAEAHLIRPGGYGDFAWAWVERPRP